MSRWPAASDGRIQRRPPSARSLLPLGLQEGEAVAGELLLALEQGSPDLRRGGEARKEPAERLDGEPAVVADRLERAEALGPAP